MSKPTVVLLPGAWHTPAVYNPLLTHLHNSSFPTLALALPSVGADPAVPDFSADVSAIRSTLTTLIVEEEKDVILVMHSYSGMPGSEAPVGLGKKEREGKGLKGGLVRLVYIMAFAQEEGFCPFDMRVGEGVGEESVVEVKAPEWMKVDMEKHIVTVAPEDAKDIFYNDLDDAEAEFYVSQLRHQSLGVYTSRTTYAAWKYIPSTFVLGRRDKSAFTRGMVEWILEEARKVTPSAFDVVEECDGGHCLMVGQAEWLSGVLKRAAGEEGA